MILFFREASFDLRSKAYQFQLYYHIVPSLIRSLYLRLFFWFSSCSRSSWSSVGHLFDSNAFFLPHFSLFKTFSSFFSQFDGNFYFNHIENRFNYPWQIWYSCYSGNVNGQFSCRKCSKVAPKGNGNGYFYSFINIPPLLPILLLPTER